MEYSRRINMADCVLGIMHPGRDLAAISSVESAILSLMDYLPLGFLIVSQTGHILAVNQSATRNLESTGVLTERNGMLSLNATPAAKKMRESIRAAQDGDPVGLRIARPGARPLSVVIAPLQNGGGRTSSAIAPAAVIYVADEQPQHTINPLLLEGLFGFTPAESRVAVHMMQGHTVGDIATSLGISEHTTRNHLKRLYAKTNTRKQCEFVHAMLTSPARFAFSVPKENASAAVEDDWSPLPVVAAVESGESLSPL
jgi:DNA-binding CsgD family transcriptional regulator